MMKSVHRSFSEDSATSDKGQTFWVVCLSKYIECGTYSGTNDKTSLYADAVTASETITTAEFHLSDRYYLSFVLESLCSLQLTLQSLL